ncbi:MAG: TonB-dependent receptor, partial [Alphaproteobacteria bacterium]
LNFLSREGGDALEADISFETNSNSRFGFEGWVSGSIADNTTFAVGAWYRADDSGRDPGFTANRGGEINGNVRHELKSGKGYIKLEFNYQDDESIFFLPQPLTGTTTNPQTIPGGMSIKDGTTGNSARARFFSLDDTPNGDLDFDLQDGQAANVAYVGTKIDYELGAGWRIVNQNRYTDLKTGFDAIINVGNARPLSIIAGEIFNRAPSRFAAAQDAMGNLFFQVRNSGDGTLLATQDNADMLNINGFGIDGGWFHRTLDAENFQNDLQLQRTFENVAGGFLGITLGGFFSDIDGQLIDHRFDTLQTIERLPQRVDIIFTQPDGASITDDPATQVVESGTGTFQGLLAGPSGFGNIIYSERTLAAYGDVEYEISDFDFNLGVRWEQLRARGGVENQGNFDLSNDGVRNDPGNPALVNLPFGDGTFRDFDLKYNKVAWTAAVNYRFNDDLSAFARYAEGFRMPDIDKYQAIATFDTTTPEGVQAIIDFNNEQRRETKPTDTIMIEAGVKFRSTYFSAAANFFYAEAKNLFFNVPTVENGQIVQRQAFRNSRTPGIEAELTTSPLEGWDIIFSGTFQKSEFFNTPAQQAIDPATGDIVTVELNGQTPVRTPDAFFQLRSSYSFGDTPIGIPTIFGSWSFSGRRFADDANTAKLSSFSLVNVGASLDVANGFYIRADLRNAFKSTGLTEGDPRAGETIFGGTSTFNARVVVPQMWTLTVGYRF